ncbi:hypothetical protein [Microbacterium karelineae]|uniref:hypothetical protein n=1 Tax=Microbacterium karelineae TaxID=2654283 RepID=UPI0012EA0645|nr:hypothetical protein [Microbacterium karelineae]
MPKRVLLPVLAVILLAATGCSAEPDTVVLDDETQEWADALSESLPESRLGSGSGVADGAESTIALGYDDDPRTVESVWAACEEDAGVEVTFTWTAHSASEGSEGATETIECTGQIARLESSREIPDVREIVLSATADTPTGFLIAAVGAE